MFEKMRVMVLSSKSLTVIMLKCRMKRGVIGFLPPPGGPMAPMNWMSVSTSLLVSFLSYL